MKRAYTAIACVLLLAGVIACVLTGPRQAELEDLNRAIERDPEDTEAYFNRGVILYSLGNLEAALADLTRAIELNPQNAGAYFSRGGIHDELGNTEEAIADYTKFLELYNTEDAISDSVRERIKALGGEVP